MLDCARCGKSIPPHPGAGRPRKFCSDRCSRGSRGPSNAERVEQVRAEFSAGKVFGRLTVVGYRDSSHVMVRCECGAVKDQTAWDLRHGVVVSCGCKKREWSGPAPVHGMAGSPEYAAWTNIKQRIFNPNCLAFPDYGGRGLTMQPEWVDDFVAFLSEVGCRPAADLSIDRIDNDLGYVRGNLRWATKSQQARNTRRAA